MFFLKNEPILYNTSISMQCYVSMFLRNEYAIYDIALINNIYKVGIIEDCIFFLDGMYND